jgi:hypothetical protein
MGLYSSCSLHSQYSIRVFHDICHETKTGNLFGKKTISHFYFEGFPKQSTIDNR